MGSWDETCMLSNLPISAGDDVVMLILTRNPYKDNEAKTGCYNTAFWFPRTLPLYAKYNDYGSIEGWESTETPIIESILAGYRLDLVEKPQTERDERLSIPARTREGLTSLEVLLGWLREGQVYTENKNSVTSEYNPTLPCIQVLIRRDVWDSMLEMSLERSNWEGGNLTLEEIRNDAAVYLKALDTLNPKDDISFLHLPEKKGCWNFFSPDCSGSAERTPPPQKGPEGLLRTESTAYFRKSKVRSERDNTQLRFFLDRAAELYFIRRVLTYTRRAWMPTTGSGSQDREKLSHFEFLLRCAGIAKTLDRTRLKEDLAEMKERSRDPEPLDEHEQEQRVLLARTKEAYTSLPKKLLGKR